MRKKLALLLSLSIIVSVFTGCNNKENKDAPSIGSTDSGNSTAIGTNVPAKVTDEFKASLKGMEVTLVWPWSVEADQVATDAYSAAYQARLKAVSEELGITFKETGGRTTYYSAMIPTIMGDKPMGNILFGTEQYLSDYAKGGIFADLTDAAKEIGIDFNSTRFNNNAISITNINNKQFGFYYLRNSASKIYYNKRILKEANLADPLELYEKGEWTFDKLTEYAKALTVRKADGSVEQKGFATWSDHDILLNAAAANGARVVDLDANGKPIMNLTDSKVQKAMEFVYKLGATDKVLTPATGTWDAAMNDFADGKIAMLLGSESTLNIVYDKQMKDEFAMVCFPKGPDKNEYVDYSQGSNFFFIPKTYQKDAAKYLYIADRIMGYDDKITPELYFDNVVGTKITDRAVLKEFKKGYLSNKTIDYTGVSGLIWSEPSIFQISNELITGTSTPTVMDSRFADMFKALIGDKWATIAITGKR